jgi:hypothetical protein
MRYLITLALDEDDDRIDSTNPVGLTLDGYERLVVALTAQGFDNIEISADEQIDSGV